MLRVLFTFRKRRIIHEVFRKWYVSAFFVECLGNVNEKKIFKTYEK